MNNRHKWYKEIQAWSEGAEIEYAVANSLNYEWHPLDSVNRFEHRNTNFRIKPQPKEDIIKMTCCFCGQVIPYNTYHACTTEHNIKPQPKEPQYLYVFADLADWEATRTSVLNRKKDYETYIGKIKLEEEQ